MATLKPAVKRRLENVNHTRFRYVRDNNGWHIAEVVYVRLPYLFNAVAFLLVQHIHRIIDNSEYVLL